MKTIRLFLILSVLTNLNFSAKAQLNADELKKITKESYDALSNHDMDNFAKYIADDAVDYAMGAEPVKGKAAIIGSIKTFFSAFPDYKISVEDIAVSGNRVYIKNNFKGTQTQPLLGMIPATGKRVDWNDTDIIEFDNKGKIKAHWANNPNEPLVQLGYGAFTNPNTAVVMTIFEKFQKRDVPTFLALIDDNFEFNAKDHPILPRMEAYKGKNDFLSWVKEYNEKVENLKLEPERFFADGDDVMVTLNVDYRIKSTGKSHSVPLVQHWRFRNGKAIGLKAIGGKSMETMTTAKN